MWKFRRYPELLKQFVVRIGRWIGSRFFVYLTVLDVRLVHGLEWVFLCPGVAHRLDIEHWRYVNNLEHLVVQLGAQFQVNCW